MGPFAFGLGKQIMGLLNSQHGYISVIRFLGITAIVTIIIIIALIGQLTKRNHDNQ